MKIQRGVVAYKSRKDYICMYALTDNGQYYFLDPTDTKKFSNGNRIASTELVEAIDPMVKASHVGIIDSNGFVVVPFENRSIRPVNDNVILVEKATPTSQSVLDANSLRSDPNSATTLVSTAATIKDKMTAQMGAEGKYLFNDQFSEVTICDINGTNLVGGKSYSFVGQANDTLYLCGNTGETVIDMFSLTTYQMLAPTEAIDVSTAVIDSQVVEDALQNAAPVDVQEAIPAVGAPADGAEAVGDVPEANIEPPVENPEANEEPPVAEPEANEEPPVAEPEANAEPPVAEPEANADAVSVSDEIVMAFDDEAYAARKALIEDKIENPEANEEPPVENPEVNEEPPVENPEVNEEPPVENPEANEEPPVENPEVNEEPPVENPEVNEEPPVENPEVNEEPPVENPEANKEPLVEEPDVPEETVDEGLDNSIADDLKAFANGIPSDEGDIDENDSIELPPVVEEEEQRETEETPGDPGELETSSDSEELETPEDSEELEVPENSEEIETPKYDFESDGEEHTVELSDVVKKDVIEEPEPGEVIPRTIAPETVSAAVDKDGNGVPDSIESMIPQGGTYTDSLKPIESDQSLLSDIFGTSQPVDKIPSYDFVSEYENDYQPLTDVNPESYDSYANAGGDNIMADVAQYMSELIKLNKKQQGVIAQYQSQISSLESQSRVLAGKNREQATKNEALISKLRSLDEVARRLEGRNQILESKVQDQAQVIAAQGRELDALRPQVQSRAEVVRILADAKNMLSAGSSYGYDESDSYYGKRAA